MDISEEQHQTASGMSNAFERLVDRALREGSVEIHDKRSRSIDFRLHFKPVRPEGQDDRWLDLGCELLSIKLGERLGVPIVRKTLVNDAEEGVGLVSLHVGERSLKTDPNADPQNASQLPKLLVFHEFVMNRDDKAKHLRVIPTDNGIRVKGIDYGHTFHRGQNTINDLDDLEDNGKLDAPVSKGELDRFVDGMDQLEPGINDVLDLTLEEIDELLDEVKAELKDKLPAKEASDFLRELPQHREIWRQILCHRRDHIAEIIERRFPNLAS